MPHLRRLSRLVRFGSRIVATVLAGSLSTRASNLPPEATAPLPTTLTLARGATSEPLALADHFRDPDVPGSAVRITTRIGAETRIMDLALFDATAPLTTANFLAYVDTGRYAANFFHRSVPGFIIQTGGFFFVNDTTFDAVPTFAPVVNESGASNLRGTIAMAKLGGDPHSATSGWFINLADNSSNLDAQNGGFTVFGRVLGDGMQVADAIAALPRYNATAYASAWTDLPLTVGFLARENFIETSAARIAPLAFTASALDPTLVTPSIDAQGNLTLVATPDRAGYTHILVTATDLEGGLLEKHLYVVVPHTEHTIVFPAIADQTDGSDPLALEATASSGLPIQFTVVSGPARLEFDYSLWQEILVFEDVGEVTIRASQAGDEIYPEAVPVERTFTIRPGPRPANDNFADATVLPARPGTVTGTNHFALSEPGEPDEETWGPSRSVWWRWTAPADGEASFDLFGSGLLDNHFATIEIFTGATLDNLTRVARWNSWSDYSPLSLETSAGTVYHLRVRADQRGAGDIRLNTSFFPTPVLGPPEAVTPTGFTARWEGDPVHYTLEITDETRGDYYPRFYIPTGTGTTRVIHGLAPGTTYRIRLAYLRDGVWRHSAPQTVETPPVTTPPPSNDSFNNPVVLAPAGGSLAVNTLYATHDDHSEYDPSPTPRSNLWYRWTAPSTGLWRFRLADRSFPAVLTLHAESDEGPYPILSHAPTLTAGDAEVSLDARAGTTWLIEISGPDGEQGAASLQWERLLAGTIPANDAIADAIAIDSALPPGGTVVTGSNRFALTSDPEWPSPDGYHSVWWRWTAPADGYLLLDTTGSAFLAQVELYRRLSDEDRYREEPHHRPYNSIPHSIPGTLFFVEAGRSYHIAVFGRQFMDSGAIRLSARFAAYKEFYLETPAAVTATGFTVSWSGAAGPYTLRLHHPFRSDQIQQTLTLASGSSHTFTGLYPNTSYTCTVETVRDFFTYWASQTINTSLPPEPAPDHDDFDHALALPAADGARSGSNLHATTGPDEPAFARASLWFDWTPETTGEWRFTLADAPFHAGLAIYTGESLGGLDQLAANQTPPAAGGATLSFDARAGVTYRILVHSVDEARGDFTLGWSLVAPLAAPANDHFAHAIALDPAGGSAPVSLRVATIEPGEPALRDAYDQTLWYPHDSGFDTQTVWYRWTAPAEGVAHFALAPTAADTVVDVYLGSSLETLENIITTDRLENRSFRSSLGVRAGETYHIRVSGRDRLDASARITAAFSPPPPAPTVASVGSNHLTLRLPDLTAIPVDYEYGVIVSTGPDLTNPVFRQFLPDEYFEYEGPTITARGLRASTRYYYQLALRFGNYHSPLITSPIGSVVTSATKAPVPANDDFAHPALLPTSGGTVSGTLNNASGEFTHPDEFVSYPSSAEVWYSLTPHATGLWRIRVAGIGFDPVFTVTTEATDSTPGDFMISSNYSTYPGQQPAPARTVERLVALRAGVSYRIGVSHQSEAVGKFTLAVSLATRMDPPANDALAAAALISGSAGTASADLRLATVESGETALDGPYLPSRRSLWWRWTALENGPVRFTLSGSDPGTALDVFTGSSFAHLALVTQRIDNGTRLEVAVSIPAQVGQTYLIRAHGWSHATAAGTLTWTRDSGPVENVIQFPDFPAIALGDAPLPLSATASSGLPVAYRVLYGPVVLEGDRLRLTGAGEFAIHASQNGDAYHAVAEPVIRHGHVSQVIALFARTRVYNGQPHPAVAVTTPSDLQVAYTYKRGSGPATPTAPTEAGTYTVTATTRDSRVPVARSATALLTIEKAPLTVSGPVLTRAVGLPNPALVLAYSGFVNGETAAVLDRKPLATTKASAKSPPGVYPITLSGGADNNYALQAVPGSLTLYGFGGGYEALLVDDTGLPLGKLELTIPANALSYTGTLRLAAEARSIVVSSTSKSSGTTSLVATPDTATLTWTRPATTDLPALRLSVTVRRDATDAPFEVISGALARAAQPFAHLDAAGRIFVPPSKTTLAWGGAHTLLVHPPAPLDSTLPYGFGHATASIASTTGLLKLTGQLADGTPLTASIKPSTLRGYVLWATPYGTRRDSFLGGYLATLPHPELAGRLHIPADLSPLTWKKAPLPPTAKTSALDKTHRAGFGPLAVPVTLDPWLPPAAAKKAKGITPAIPAITLADRLGLAASSATGTAAFGLDYLPPPGAAVTEAQIDGLPAVLGLTLALAGKPVLPKPNPARFALTLNSATGAFSGSFVLTDTIPAGTTKNPDATKLHSRKVSFRGVLRQPATSETPGDAPLGQGFFLLPALPGAASTEQVSGEIRLLAPAP